MGVVFNCVKKHKNLFVTAPLLTAKRPSLDYVYAENAQIASDMKHTILRYL